MVNLTINNIPVKVPNNTTVLAACEHLGIVVPRFCYHQKLSIAGNCRSCLVEVFKAPKPIVSCATPVMPGMKVFTETPLVKKARESVFEFLLKNHPLDCPICDQGGECDLQDQSFFFGNGASRFFYEKRSVEDKNINPLIKTIMTRCIHCTRCVRFGMDVAGVNTLGTTNRGETTEISTYVDRLMDSEVAGNVIDLCPVGALTSKPYAFLARPWELSQVNSLDLTDGLGSNIVISHRFGEIKRVGPRRNDNINSEWISDKARFSFDGCLLETPNINTSESENLLLSLFLSKATSVKGKKTNLNVVIDEILDLETLFLYNTFFSTKTKKIFMTSNSEDFSQKHRLKKTIASLNQSDCVVFVGVDLKTEAAIADLIVREGRLTTINIDSYKFGAASSTPTYPSQQIEISPKSFQHFTQGIAEISSTIAKSKKPFIVFGSSFSKRKDFQTILGSLETLNKNLQIVDSTNLLASSANSAGYASLNLKNFYAANKKTAQVNFFVGFDNDAAQTLFKNASKIGGSFIFSLNPANHNVNQHVYSFNNLPMGILRSGSFFNVELRYQESKTVPKPKLNNTQEIEMLRLGVLFDILQKLDTTKAKQPLSSYVPQVKNRKYAIEQMGLNKTLFMKNKLYKNFLKANVSDFFRTDSVSKNSKTMFSCSLTRRKNTTNFYNTK